MKIVSRKDFLEKEILSKRNSSKGFRKFHSLRTPNWRKDSAYLKFLHALTFFRFVSVFLSNFFFENLKI